MKNSRDFVPLASLVHSLGNHRRLYFLYRKAAETGSPGARLRFRLLKGRLSDFQLRDLEVLFEGHRRTGRSA